MAQEALADVEKGHPKVGALIRARRRQQQMTLMDLGASAEVSVGYLSQVERDHATPSLGTLAQIARALGVSIDYFVSAPAPHNALTRAGERNRFSLDGSSIIYERLGADFPGNQLSSFIMSVPPGYRSETVAHEGEEILYVLEGAITQRLDGEEMVMNAGDSLHFRGNRPHSWSNHTDQPAKLLWTGTLALFRSTARPPRPAIVKAKTGVNKPVRKKSHFKGETHMKLFRAALLASALSLPLAAGAVYAATPADALVIAQNIDDIVALDPAQAYEFSAGEINTNVYDRLVQYEAEDTTTLVGGLAESWEADDAAKSIVFTIRDAKFASGNPVRAEDVHYSFKRVITLNLTPAFILTQLGWTVDNIDDMVTVDGNTVTVKWEGDFASAFVLNVLAARPASIVDEALVSQHVEGEDWGNAWLNTNSAGSGPFVMTDYRPAELVRLSANENYFRGVPAMKQILIRHVAEAATQQLLLTSGDIDIAKNLTPDQISGLPADTVKVETYPQAAVHFLSFNQKTDSLTNPAVWEAARYLVDYDGMTETFLKGQMEKHQAFWPKGFPGSYDETPYTYDVEKAKQILADAGVETPINVTLDVINSTPFTDIAQSLQAGFAEAGINFDILPGTGAQVITKYRERTHQAMLLYWGPDFMDPHSNAKAFAYNSNNADDNYTATTTWRNAWAVPEELNTEVTAALAEPDQAKRNEMYIDLQKKVQAESPIVIMFQAALTIAMANNVEGYVNGATSDFVYYRLVTKN